MSDDGATIVGWAMDAQERRHAFLWRDPAGVVDVALYLRQRGVDLDGWSDFAAESVNSDGDIVAGNAVYQGQFQAWIAGFGGTPCYANCDGSTSFPILDASDFMCFRQQFAAGSPYANCDGSSTPPVLNVADFICFLQHFAAGCS